VKINNRAKSFVVMFAALALAIPALAKMEPRRYFQMDPGELTIRQNGGRVGEIYVPDREPGATKYVEHWVLYDNYVYPGKDNASLVTTIEPGRASYKSEEDFFARVPWGEGFRYVRVDCTDTDRLPGR